MKLAPNRLYSDSNAAKGSEGDSYMKMTEAKTRAIAEAFGEKYTQFQPKK